MGFQNVAGIRMRRAVTQGANNQIVMLRKLANLIKGAEFIALLKGVWYPRKDNENCFSQTLEISSRQAMPGSSTDAVITGQRY